MAVDSRQNLTPSLDHLKASLEYGWIYLPFFSIYSLEFGTDILSTCILVAIPVCASGVPSVKRQICRHNNLSNYEYIFGWLLSWYKTPICMQNSVDFIARLDTKYTLFWQANAVHPHALAIQPSFLSLLLSEESKRTYRNKRNSGTLAGILQM